jgi:hypothetical protein
MFALGTDSFVIAGLLPGIASGFQVSIEAAGQMWAVSISRRINPVRRLMERAPAARPLTIVDVSAPVSSKRNVDRRAEGVAR